MAEAELHSNTILSRPAVTLRLPSQPAIGTAPWQLQALPIVGVVNRWCGQLPTRTTRARTIAEFRFGQLPVRESAGENEIDCGINSSSSRSCAAGVALDAGTERRYGTPAWIASTDRWSGTATLVRWLGTLARNAGTGRQLGGRRPIGVGRLDEAGHVYNRVDLQPSTRASHSNLFA